MKYINRNKLVYFRESDGHTYLYTADGWCGTATLLNGTPDLEGWSYVSEYESDMEPADYAELTAWLQNQGRS
jgi:hypothetical protein